MSEKASLAPCINLVPLPISLHPLSLICLLSIQHHKMHCTFTCALALSPIRMSAPWGQRSCFVHSSSSSFYNCVWHQMGSQWIFFGWMHSLRVTAIVITDVIIFPAFLRFYGLCLQGKREPITSPDPSWFSKPRICSTDEVSKLLKWKQIQTELLRIKGLRSPCYWTS